MLTHDILNARGAGKLPGYLVTHVNATEIGAELMLRAEHMAPNGYLHAGSIALHAADSFP